MEYYRGCFCNVGEPIFVDVNCLLIGYTTKEVVTIMFVAFSNVCIEVGFI